MWLGGSTWDGALVDQGTPADDASKLIDSPVGALYCWYCKYVLLYAAS